MKKIYCIIALFCALVSNAQVVINEIDADTPGADTAEFIELKSATANFSLNGYVLVFFNGTSSGTGNASYLTIDLDGYQTDINGIVHFGNSLVSPTPISIITNAVIQNGPDAVALYLGNGADFPNNTAATNTGLIDALAYSNGPTVQPTTLMGVFGLSVCVNENANGNVTTESIQRKNDGTYELKAPTPGVNNDGSGIPLPSLTIDAHTTSVNEGNVMDITFTTSQPVTGNFNIAYTLNNGGFNSSDFTGALTATITAGNTFVIKTIQILNDGVNEGDEELKITATSIPAGYVQQNNNIIVRVIDVNFTTLPFGTPANPTYGAVASTAPVGYYSSLEGLAGPALKQAIQNIIANPAVVRAHSYGDVISILKTADQNPLNNNQVWLIYTEQPRSKIDYQTGSSIVGKWNREHTYCQSRGNYGDLYNTNPDGINVWAASGPDDIGAGLSDAHHLRAVDGQENSSRNNRNYGVDYNGPSGTPTSSWKGDVSRALFYMAVRYIGLNVVNGDPVDGTLGQIGDLATLLTWNHSDPSDDFEMNRNNYIYTWQMNRNPFIDHPSLADYIWGTHVGEQWFSALSTDQFADSKVVLYPNPANDFIYVSGITGVLEIYNVSGAKLSSTLFTGETRIPIDLAAGVYLVRITSENNSTVKKLIVR